LISQILSYQPHRDPSEGVPDEIFNVRCWHIELDDRNRAQAFTERSNRGVQGDAMCSSVNGVHSRGDWTVDFEVDRKDGVAIPINLGQLIEARSVHDGLCVIGCHCSHVVIEVRPGGAKHSSPKLHGQTISPQGERKVSFRLMVTVGPHGQDAVARGLLDWFGRAAAALASIVHLIFIASVFGARRVDATL
jgi:hypothetical protein